LDDRRASFMEPRVALERAACERHRLIGIGVNSEPAAGWGVITEEPAVLNGHLTCATLAETAPRVTCRVPREIAADDDTDTFCTSTLNTSVIVREAAVDQLAPTSQPSSNTTSGVSLEDTLAPQAAPVMPTAAMVRMIINERAPFNNGVAPATEHPSTASVRLSKRSVPDERAVSSI
jgi:hypothetical protein